MFGARRSGRVERCAYLEGAAYLLDCRLRGDVVEVGGAARLRDTAVEEVMVVLVVVAVVTVVLLYSKDLSTPLKVAVGTEVRGS
jgi:hypothetical protein